MALNIIHSVNYQSLKSVSASLLCGIIFSISLANVAVAAEDPKVVADQILKEAIPEFQNTMASMSQGCHNGQGIPPLNWGTRQEPGNKAVESLSNARVSLSKNNVSDAKNYIENGLNQWDELINALARSCSGGHGGDDPTYYGRYVGYKNQVRERMLTVLRFL